MRPYVAIPVLVALAALARAEGVPPATTIAEIARLGPAASVDPVRVQGTVTYFDPTRRCLCLQDRGAGLFVHIPLDARPLHPGQRAEVRGRVLAHNYLDATEARPVGEDALPDPITVTGEQFVTRSPLNRRVALAGVVRATGLEADRAIIYLMAGRTPVRVFVRDPGPGARALDRLVDAEVRAVGVCGAAVEGRGLDGMELLVQSLDAVAVVRPAPDRPFGLPLTPLAEVPDWAEHRVRVAGEAVGPVADGVLTLRAAGRAVAVAVGADVTARAGDRFEAVGFPGRRDGLPFLDDAVVRGFAPRRGVRAAEAGPDDLLPIVRAVSELRRMSVDEVNRGCPVSLQATVTFHDPRLGMMFVHDGIEGIYVDPPADLARQPAGRVVRLDGFTDPGDFAPMIHAGRVTPVRDGQLPAAPRFGYDELVGGRADSQWVEVEAVVRGAGRDSWGNACLLLRFGPATVPAVVAGTDPGTLTGLFGATARVRASLGSTFNDRRQWSGLTLYVPGPDAIEVRAPAPAGFADLPARTVESLSYFDPARGPGEPVKLRGTVIARRGSVVVLQDATGGITADLRPAQPGAVGEQVEVRGFLVRRGTAWAVEDGLARPEGPGEPQAARDVTPGQIAAGGHAATLVRVEAIVVDQFPAGEADQVFLLRSVVPEAGTHLFFPALLPRDQVTPELAELRPGTRVRLTGACTLPNERLMVSSFRLLPRTAADFEVLDRPSWWTPRKALVTAGGVASVAILSLAWVMTLRRRVLWQTEQIRRRLEREAHLEARYRDLFESASDAVFALDPIGTIKAMNRAGRELTGLAVGGSFLGAVAPGSLGHAKELLDSRSPMTREIALNAPGGVVVLEVSARPTLDGGSSTGVQAIARDLTDRRRLEAELRQAQKMEAIGRLAGGIAHDFNNLLTVINGNGEVLRARLPAADGGLADEIVRAGEQAATLTRQLLSFSRKGVVAPRVLRPNDTIDGVRRMLARLVGERVQLVTDLDPAAGCVRIDPGQLEQALLNLAVNARDAMPRGGTVTIRTRARPHDVRIEVTDTGMGMDAATRARAFEPFFTTKPAGEGTGLGLATVRGIVEQAGGAVAVASDPGRGATFTIDLPVCTDGRPLECPSSVAPPPANREVILLVEDEPAVQLLERRVLEMGRYEVLVASSGEEALTLLDGHAARIDLLVTDVVMPGMTGRELAEAVARRRPGLRALFLSGYTPDEVLRQGVRADEAHFLQKPFTPSSLLGKVREVLSRP
jgi:PAS domain S-box-containing protein